MTINDNILKDVSDYYAEKLREYGLTPAGVDWNSEESQELRFSQLLKVVEGDNFSLLDYGCGYGALLPYLNKSYPMASYSGYDCEESMIDAARKENTGLSASWTTQISENAKYDYIVASGIFNVRLEHSDDSWAEYIKSILQIFNKHANKGFSFNVLTAYSDKEYMRDYLYYADPSYFFDYCKKEFSKYVAVLHDYPLYEFTILVKKD